MSEKDKVDKARKAVDKLNKFTKALPKGTSSDHPMYSKLNSEADKAIKALPKHLQSRRALDWY